MVVEFSFGDFFCGLCDRRRSLGVEQTQVLVRLCRGPFNQTHSANEWPRKSEPLTGKFKTARCVDAPWRASAGTVISPIESFSIRVRFSVMPNALRRRRRGANGFSI